jgi:hypothetical protein
MASLLLIVPCRRRSRLLRRREARATAAGRCLVRRHVGGESSRVAQASSGEEPVDAFLPSDASVAIPPSR